MRRAPGDACEGGESAVADNVKDSRPPSGADALTLRMGQHLRHGPSQFITQLAHLRVLEALMAAARVVARAEPPPTATGDRRAVLGPQAGAHLMVGVNAHGISRLQSQDHRHQFRKPREIVPYDLSEPMS